MPFKSDEQRKAAFANMKKRGTLHSNSGSGATYGNDYTDGYGIGYSGNYTNGLPDFSNWYTSYLNIVDPALAPSGPSWLQGGDTFDWTGWQTGAGGYIWLIDPDKIGGVRDLTTAEKLLLGIPLAAAVGWAAPTIFGGGAIDYGLAAGLDVAISAPGSTLLSIAGTQGGSLGFSAVAITGLPMSVNDSMYTSVDGINVVGSYPDLASWIGSFFD